jgi:hypothetical protein
VLAHGGGLASRCPPAKPRRCSFRRRRTGRVHRKKGQVSGYDRPVSWIYVLSHFDGTERWVSFWFSFAARLSRERFFDMIPGSADLIPD